MLKWAPASVFFMSRHTSQHIESTPTTLSRTAEARIGGVWKDSRPVEFAIAPTSAVTVRANALTVSAQAAAMALALVIMNAAMLVVAEMMQVASLGMIICPECR